MESGVKDYGEPLRLDRENIAHAPLEPFDRHGRPWHYRTNYERTIQCVNLLAGIQTDPLKMDSRTERVLGLLRAIGEGDEGAFRGNLDDLAASEMLVDGETFTEGLEIEERFGPNAKWHGKEYHYYSPDRMEHAKKVLETFRRNNPDFSYRIVRVLTKTEVVQE